MAETGAAIWPVILSGGAGTRLWPLSRAASPKQLLALTGERTMLQETALRCAGPGFHAPVAVCGAAHAAAIAEQLAAVGVSQQTLIVEPAARNTAAAIALAALEVAAHDPGGVLLVMPSDHVIDRPGALLAAVGRGRGVVADGWLATFGIAPAAPETGYGYIEAGAEIAPGVRAAARFVEKPDRIRAEAMLAQGGFFWNGGIFLFRADAFLAALSEHAPEVLAAARAAMAGAVRSGDTLHPDAAAFVAAPSISVDYAVMEKAARVAVIPVDMGWTDIGGWDALFDHGPADGAGNVVAGRAEALDTTNCLLRAEGVTLAAIGLSGLTVVATPDAVLVAARGRGQDVRDVAARLSGTVLERPVVVAHAWGTERLVSDGGGVAVRLIDLAAGGEWRAAGGERVMLLSGVATGDGMVLAAGELATVASVSSDAGARLLAFAEDHAR